MIYVMRVGARWKVGHSHDPVDRAYQLSGQHDWGEVAIVALGIGSEGDEAAIHKALAPLRARERKLEREYYADCDEFRLWRDAIDAFWRGNEVFCTERMRGIVTRPKVAFSLREAVRVGQRRYLGDLDGNCGRRLTWHTTAEQVLRGELRRGSVGGEQAAAVCVTLPVESARQREASRLFGPTGDGPPVAPTPHTWLVHAGAVRVSFRCRECFSKHTVPFPDRAVCYGAADPAQKAATILFGTVGPPSVDHHRGTLKQALLLAATDATARMGLPVAAPQPLDTGPIVVGVEEVATDVVGLGSDAHPSRVAARVHAEDPDPVGTLQELWRGSPQERHAAGVVAIAKARWAWRQVHPPADAEG